MIERSGGLMKDLISREKAIEALLKEFERDTPKAIRAKLTLENLPSAQPEKRTDKCTEMHACDCIDRQAAIDAHYEYCNKHPDAGFPVWSLKILEDLPSAQPILYGYPVEHLAMIAMVLQKENFPPERISEMLSDVGRIVDMVRDAFEETLRKAVEQCTMT